MPFRERFKKAFGIHDENSSSSSQNKSAQTVPTSTAPVAEGALVGRRRPIDRVQKERMDQYSFSEDGSDRKASLASQYSPMGSKLPSRHNSSDATGGGTHKSARGHNPVGSDIKEDENVEPSSDPARHDRDPELQGQPDTEKDIKDGTTTDTKIIDNAEVSKALNTTGTQIPAAGM